MFLSCPRFVRGGHSWMIRSKLKLAKLAYSYFKNTLISVRLQLRHIKQSLSQIAETLKHCSSAGFRYPFDTQDCSRIQRNINYVELKHI